MTLVEKQEIIRKYAEEMANIKARIRLIFSANALFEQKELQVEYKALQLRKIIEQILLCSLIANAEEYEKYYNKFAGKEWNARWISRDLERVNKNFFPKQATNDPALHKVETVLTGMSCEEIIKIYEKLGLYLHAKNPFSSSIDYDSVLQMIDGSCLNICKLLSIHTTELLGGDAVLLVIMNTSNRNGQVTVEWCDKVDPSEYEEYLK